MYKVSCKINTVTTNTNVNCLQQYNTSLRLSWSYNSFNPPNGYILYRATSQNCTYSQIYSTTNGTKSYTDTGLKTGTTYYYKVMANNTSSTGHKIYSDYPTVKSGAPK
ncbi:MAG TPA: hypothetical protein DCM73_00040 [Clostridiales bacterium]|nr:fibronectin type III domain-containing protein [Anaeropeptidivorans aminofermentans]HAQ39377.1 hypothetical protein [Clostridiales bacterium]